MSKFFFKGRQDARQNHINHGYQTNASKKNGSKKYPLALTVTSDARKKEIEALLAEAQLHADISVDTNENAVESINELTVFLDKGKTIKLNETPTRNEPCHCGSGKKYKKCCG